MTYELQDYVDVKERLRLFYAKHPEGSLQFELVDVRDLAGKTVLIGRAYAYRHPDDTRPGVGTAWELVPGATPYTRGSELMNLETSCWGRAIGSLGIGTDRAVATAQEVAYAKARRSSSTPDDDPYYTDPPPAVEAAKERMGARPSPSGRRVDVGDDRATEKQTAALDKMAGKLGYEGLGELLASESELMLGRKATVEDLTKAEASAIFDAVKAFQGASHG
jgi:hypothetical protein